MAKHCFLPLGLMALAGLLTTGCGRDDAPGPFRVQGSGGLPAPGSTPALRVEVPPPPFSDGVFPCTECHVEKDLPTNRTRRSLVDAHDDIVLKHDQENRWCLDCHDAGNRDRLHLASGEPVPFDAS